MWHGDHMATRAKLYPEVNRAELAKVIEKDRGYVTNILNGKRAAPLSIALAVFDETGLKLGPLEGKSKADISTLRRAHQITSAA